MPSISKDNREQSTNNLEEALVDALGSDFKVVCGVNRKVNTGNYENIDVFIGVGVPVNIENPSNVEELRELLSAAADLGIKFASEATYERYTQIRGG